MQTFVNEIINEQWEKAGVLNDLAIKAFVTNINFSTIFIPDGLNL